jgi:hypothetical protein
MEKWQCLSNGKMVSLSSWQLILTLNYADKLYKSLGLKGASLKKSGAPYILQQIRAKVLSNFRSTLDLDGRHHSAYPSHIGGIAPKNL